MTYDDQPHHAEMPQLPEDLVVPGAVANLPEPAANNVNNNNNENNENNVNNENNENNIVPIIADTINVPELIPMPNVPGMFLVADNPAQHDEPVHQPNVIHVPIGGDVDPNQIMGLDLPTHHDFVDHHGLNGVNGLNGFSAPVVYDLQVGGDILYVGVPTEEEEEEEPEQYLHFVQQNDEEDGESGEMLYLNFTYYHH